MRSPFAEDYFEWICNLIEDRRHLKYRKLLNLLFDTDFEYLMEMDANRYEDGIDLRYKFGYENYIPDAQVTVLLDNKPCSILEMMVALAVRCENDIMSNTDIGNRTPEWFWKMIGSLGLGRMIDSNFDEAYCKAVLKRFIERRYNANGAGGLFTIPNIEKNMTEVEIWYQAMWYLDSIGTDI